MDYLDQFDLICYGKDCEELKKLAISHQITHFKIADDTKEMYPSIIFRISQAKRVLVGSTNTEFCEAISGLKNVYMYKAYAILSVSDRETKKSPIYHSDFFFNK